MSAKSFGTSAFGSWRMPAIIAPWREWNLLSREKLLAYAEKNGIPIEMKHKKGGSPYSMDANLLHISYEGGILEDPGEPPPSDIFELTMDPQACPDGDSEITIDFEHGVPIGVNGEAIPAVQLLDDLSQSFIQQGLTQD